MKFQRDSRRGEESEVNRICSGRDCEERKRTARDGGRNLRNHETALSAHSERFRMFARALAKIQPRKCSGKM